MQDTLTGHEEEDHNESTDVHGGVEAESSNGTESGQHAGEREGDDRGPEEARRHSP